MSDYNSLKAAINANIRKNGRQEITGQVLNGILRAMVDALGAGFTFRAVASPDTDPGSTDSRVFYIATIPGTYGHMGGIEIEEGEVAILKFYDDEWHKEPTGLASQAALESLGDTLGTAIGEKMTFCELWCDGDKITRKDSQIALSFAEVKELMDDPSQFVALKYIDVFWMLPQYDDEGGAIIFTGVSLMSAQGDLWRVAINEEDQISDYSIAIENQYLKTNDLGDEQRDNFKTYPTTQAVNAALDDKVDKVPGKGLSSNDFTTQEKNKLAGLNNYDDTELRSQVQSGVTAASGSAAQAVASAASAESKYAGILQAMENLPDGSAVSAQVALNTQKVTELEDKIFETKEGEFIDGYWSFSGGVATIVSRTDYSCAELDVSGLDAVYIKYGSGNHLATGSPTFFADDNRKLLQLIGDADNVLVEHRINIPIGAKYIMVSNKKSLCAEPKLILHSSTIKGYEKLEELSNEVKGGDVSTQYGDSVLIESGYIESASAQAGTITPHSQFKSSDFIDLSDVTSISILNAIIMTSGYNIAFYDSTKTYIQGTGVRIASVPTHITIPAGAKYYRICNRITGTLLYTETKQEPSLDEKISRANVNLALADRKRNWLKSILECGIGERVVHFSIDDVNVCLADLIARQNSIASIYANGMLGELKTIHETYGLCITLNCFNQFTVGGVNYDINQLPNKFSAELQAAKSWLRWSMHGLNSTKTYADAIAAEVASEYEHFVSAIYNFTGDYDCIDRQIRLNNFQGNLDVCKALRNCTCAPNVFSCSDDGRTSYYLNATQQARLDKTSKLFDEDTEIVFVKTQPRFDNSANVDVVKQRLENKPMQSKYVEIFYHESRVVPAHISTFCSWLKDKGFIPAFISDCFLLQ